MNLLNSSIELQQRQWRNTSWINPVCGWILPNTDGASKGNLGEAAVGGFLRDDNGRWLHNFMYNSGFSSSVLAELWGVRFGPEIAWELEILADSTTIGLSK